MKKKEEEDEDMRCGFLVNIILERFCVLCELICFMFNFLFIGMEFLLF